MNICIRRRCSLSGTCAPTHHVKVGKNPHDDFDDDDDNNDHYNDDDDEEGDEEGED